MNEEAYIDKEWLTIQNYEFKILVMIAVLAENHLAYRGKLKDMCEFLGVGSSTTNRDKIKAAIQTLEEKGDIKYIQEGQTWTLTLSVKAERKQKIIRIKNAWIKLIQAYKAETKEDSVAWENILKVFVYLCADKREIKRYDEIAKDLHLTEKTIKRSMKALSGINFKDIDIKKKLAWFVRENEKHENEYRVIGQHIDVVLNFEG